MDLHLTTKQYRRLLDLVYIGNWILNSTRGDDRLTDYDEVESTVFSAGRADGMEALTERFGPDYIPSRAFAEGGIHEAIMDYEDTVFFEILAEELARRDILMEGGPEDDMDELNARIREYITEFELNGTDNITLSN